MKCPNNNNNNQKEKVQINVSDIYKKKLIAERINTFCRFFGTRYEVAGISSFDLWSHE